jgi:DNA-binding winged helix-turn-helix (wHTH) protein
MTDKPLIYGFDDVRVELASFRLFKAGESVALEPKAFEALIFLIERRGRLVTKDELLDGVWKDAFVTPNALTRIVAQLRRALGEGARAARYI